MGEERDMPPPPQAEKQHRALAQNDQNGRTPKGAYVLSEGTFQAPAGNPLLRTLFENPSQNPSLL